MSKTMIFAVCFALFAASTLGVAQAQNVTDARQGTVLAVRWSHATPSQNRDYNRGYRGPSRTRQVVGGTIGGVLGYLAARHSDTGRYIGAAGGAAIGQAIGEQADRRHERREDAPSTGAQVIVKLGSDRTVAVFVPQREAGRFYAGQNVWLIGQDQLVPGS